MDEADRCFQLAMMREGKLMETGTPEEIKTKYQVAAIEEAFWYWERRLHNENCCCSQTNFATNVP